MKRAALSKIISYKKLKSLRQVWKRQGLIVVFTNGCFDLIHVGHVQLLQQAKSFGDILIVAVNTDETIREAKGPARPIVPLSERMEILGAFGYVDYLFPFYEPTPQRVIAELLPDVLVKGSDWGANEVVGKSEVESAGGKVVRVELFKGKSTTELVQAIVKTALHNHQTLK